MANAESRILNPQSLIPDPHPSHDQPRNRRRFRAGRRPAGVPGGERRSACGPIATLPGRSRDLSESAAEIVADPKRSLYRHRGHRQGSGREGGHAGANRLAADARRVAARNSRRACWRFSACPASGPNGPRSSIHELRIATLDELREACESHKIQRAQGLWGQDRGGHPARAGHRLRGRASGSFGSRPTDLVQEILEHMQGCRAVEKIVAAGSYRRGKETVGDLDFLVVADDAECGDGPPGGLRRRRGDSASAATRRCRCGWPPACRSICGRCRPSRSARPCNTSPARRPTTSCCAAGQRRGG